MKLATSKETLCHLNKGHNSLIWTLAELMGTLTDLLIADEGKIYAQIMIRTNNDNYCLFFCFVLIMKMLLFSE